MSISIRIKDRKRLIENYKKLRASRSANLEKLKEWSMEDLNHHKAGYLSAAQDREMEGKKLSAKVMYEKYSQICEAIWIKKGNKEEILIGLAKYFKGDLVSNIQKLKDFPFDDLVKWEKELLALYNNYKKAGYKRKAKSIDEKHNRISQALSVKQGNNEEVWDSLT